MNPFLRNTLAVIAGLVIGSIVNMSIILLSGSIIPAPNGADVSTTEGLKATMHLFEPKHFLFPFLAHSIGTFAGALTTAVVAIKHKTKLAFGIGAFFLFGGIVTVFTLPSPIWFGCADLIFAYIPMAYLASRIALKKKK
ncbi:hypothetical protein [Flavobacterium sp.]|uniref:hypothetical protein n=1 Tax=Flavobacterium sp. TaxID=239 RepID=UPI0031DB1289